MFYEQNKVAHIFVMKNVAPKTSGQVENYNSFAADGTMAILDENNNALSDVTNYSRFRIAQRSGESVLYSPFIEKAKLVRAIKTPYSAPANPVHYIGYNGSTGSIEAINSNIYEVRMLLHSNFKTFGNKQMLKYGIYKSDASATQQEVAHGILDNLIANFKRETLINVQFDLVNSCGLGSDYATDNNVTVVKGVKAVTIATAATYDTGTAIAVDDYIRLSDTSATTAVALTDQVYRVTSISSLTLFLDREVTNASGTYTAASGSATIIPAASIANFGIKVTGIAYTFKVGVWRYEVPKFDIYLQDFGSTAVTVSTAAAEPKGYGAQIQEMEYFLRGNHGNKYKLGIPVPTPTVDATATVGYNQLILQYYDIVADNNGMELKAPKDIIIAFLEASDTHPNAFLHVLHSDTTNAVTAACTDW